MIALLFVPLVLYLFLLIGAFGGVWKQSVDSTLKLSDFINLVAATIAAYVIQYALLKRTRKTDGEKVLLQRQVQDTLELTGRLRSLIRENVGKRLSPQDASSIATAFDECSNSLSSLEFCIQQSHCEQLKDLCSEAGQTLLRYKRMITGDNFPLNPLTSVDIGRSSNVERQLDQKLRLLVFEIGKADSR